MSKWHGGKGSDKRKASISCYEEDLRWELVSSKTPQSRKNEINAILTAKNENIVYRNFTITTALDVVDGSGELVDGCFKTVLEAAQYIDEVIYAGN